MKKTLYSALSIFFGAAMLGSCNDPKSNPDPDPEPPVDVDITVTPTFAEGEYVYDPQNGDIANYYIALGEMEIENPMTEQPTFKGEGHVMFLNMFALKSAEMIIPSGNYVFDATGEGDHEQWFDNYTGIYVIDKSGAPVDGREITSGKVTVSRSADQYTIEFSGKDESNKTIYCKYVGKIGMSIPAPVDPDDVFPPLVNNFEAEFNTVAKAYYLGLNENNAGQFKIQLTEGTDDGKILDIELFSTVVDKNYVIAPGTYKIAETNAVNTLVPGWINTDALVNLGTNCTEMYYTSDDRLKPTYGMASEGTIVVALNGDQYTLTIDLIASNGKTIKGTYTGKIAVTDRSYNSTITEDIEANITGTPCEIEFLGNVLADKGIDGNVWDVYITPDNGTAPHVVMLRLVTPAGGTFADGLPFEIYPITHEYETGGHIAIPGEQSIFGELACSWYLKDVDGFRQKQEAPLVSGEITIDPEEGEGKYYISIMAGDDAPIPATHNIMIDWVGVPKFIDVTKNKAPYAINFKASAKKQVFEPKAASMSNKNLQRNYIVR